MFWSGNYCDGKATNTILTSSENVTLLQLMEAEDILHECKENMNLIKFLSRPEIVSELLSLVLEEPPSNKDLHTQYKNASLACEILSSNIPSVRSQLASDVSQMNRLCDFLDCDPPLNPLLASYFSKIIEMLFKRVSPQDWCSYQIMCIDVLVFFQNRTDFLPNLFKHIGTSAIMDTLKFFIQLDSLTKQILTWFEDHEFLETLIQIICGTHTYNECNSKKQINPSSENNPSVNTNQSTSSDEQDDNKQETYNINGRIEDDSTDNNNEKSVCDVTVFICDIETRKQRLERERSANAAALLCDLFYSGCALEEHSMNWPETGMQLMSKCGSEPFINLLLQSMFTSPPHFRQYAIVNGIQVLFAMLDDTFSKYNRDGRVQQDISNTSTTANQERAVAAIAPHVPLLHQVLLDTPVQGDGIVGAMRVNTARLIALLIGVDSTEVYCAIKALNSIGVLLELCQKYPHNSFLHSAATTAVINALDHPTLPSLYVPHVLQDCDLLNVLVNMWEENKERKKKKEGSAAYTGRILQLVGMLGDGTPTAEEPDYPTIPSQSEQMKEPEVSITQDRKLNNMFNMLVEPLSETTLVRWNEFYMEVKPLLLLAQQVPLGGPDLIVEDSYQSNSGELGPDDNEEDNLTIATLNKLFNFNEQVSFQIVNKIFSQGLLPPDDIGHSAAGCMVDDDNPWGESNVKVTTEEGWANFNDNTFWDYNNQQPPSEGLDECSDPFLLKSSIWEQMNDNAVDNQLTDIMSDVKLNDNQELEGHINNEVISCQSITDLSKLQEQEANKLLNQSVELAKDVVDSVITNAENEIQVMCSKSINEMIDTKKCLDNTINVDSSKEDIDQR